VKLTLRPGVAEKVFHITAANECRFNFALNSVKPAWPELALPGAHSDNVSFRSIGHQTPKKAEKRGCGQIYPENLSTSGAPAVAICWNRMTCSGCSTLCTRLL